MSIYGYKPKTKPATWRSVHPTPAVPTNVRKIQKQAKATWTHVHPVAPVAKPRKRIRSVSKGNVERKAQYRLQAAAFLVRAVLNGERCPVVAAVPSLHHGMKYGHPVSDKINDCHHFYGRIGKLLLAEWSYIALSKQGHRFVHENIAEARKLGFICEPGLWNNYEAAKADAIRRGWLAPERGKCRGCGFTISPECEWCGECLCEEDGL